MVRFVFALLLVACAQVYAHHPAWAADKTALERIKDSGVIRCGYSIYPPYFIKDVEQKDAPMTGIYPDIFNEIAKQAELKIEWVEEESMDSVFTALESKRIDVMCAPMTYTPARAKIALFTTPFVYVPFYLYVRKDETRLSDKNNYASLNDPAVKFITLDGDITRILADQFFPQAEKLALPALTDAAQIYLSISQKKGDVLIGEPVYAGIFMKNNPDQIRQLAGRPLRVFPATAAVAMGEHDLNAFLNTSLQSLWDEGFIDATIRKHVVNADDLLTLAPAYEVKK